MIIHQDPPSIRAVLRSHKQAIALIDSVLSNKRSSVESRASARERRNELVPQVTELETELLRLTGNKDVHTPEAWR